MPWYIRYLLSAVHTTWSDLNFAVGTEMEDENGREGNMKTESEEKEGCGQVPWCGLSLNCYLPAGSGVFNLTLYSTIWEWEFIATSTRDCSGIKWLICLCYPRRIRGSTTSLFVRKYFYGPHSSLHWQTINWLRLTAYGTTNFDINLSDPDEPLHNNTLTRQVAIL